MSSNSKSGAKPKLACEVSADRILAARVADGEGVVSTCAALERSPGSVIPYLIENNLVRRDSVRAAIQETLASIGDRSRDVIAVLPDAAVRVALLDFEMLPSNRDEAEAVVRFRLKKSLPFDVEKGRVSDHAHTSVAGGQVVAAVALSSVVEECEGGVREAGHSHGMETRSMRESS